jgi:uncharacterized protein YjiS (DUF1127 family)
MSDRTFTLFSAPGRSLWSSSSAHWLARTGADAAPASRVGLPERGRRQPEPPRAAGVWARLRLAWRRYRTRQYLVGLDAYLLKDIGVSYAEAEAEANKPFWLG